jgi:hypothetical protein
VSDRSDLGIPDLAALLLGDRPETGQLVQVSDAPDRHSKHAGTVK